MTIRVRVNSVQPWTTRQKKVNHTTMVSPTSSLRGAVVLKISSSASMPYSKVVHMPKCASDHQGVGWIQSFPLQRHPPVTGSASRFATAMPSSLVQYCLLIIYSKPIHIYMHIYIYISTHLYAHRLATACYTIG